MKYELKVRSALTVALAASYGVVGCAGGASERRDGAAADTVTVTSPDAAAPAACDASAPPIYNHTVEPQTVEVAVGATTDAGITIDPNESHVILLPTHRPPNDHLFVHLTGSRGRPNNNREFLRMAAFTGFRALSLAYPNHPLTDYCDPARFPTPDATNECQAQVREEMIYGRDVSSRVVIPRPDSIEARIVALVRWLDATRPGEGWGAYLDGALPRWGKIILSGFSQGGPNVAMISRDHDVGAVLIFASATDVTLVNDDPSRIVIAQWASQPRRTDPFRLFSFLHREEGGWLWSPGVLRTWGAERAGPFVDVDTQRSPYGCTHLLSTAVRPSGSAEPHGSLTNDNALAIDRGTGLPINAPAYMYLFTQLNAVALR